MAAVLQNVIVPGGNLTLVMTSDEAWRKQRDEEEPITADNISGDIRIQVDAAHLMRISKPFQVFLDFKSKEGAKFCEDGQIELTLDEDDPEAMCHLMNCVFGRMKEVPGPLSDAEIDFETFVEACVIVDKYDLHEPTWFLMEHWWVIHCVNQPRSLSSSFFKWVSVTHILKKKKNLDALLRIYIREGSGLDAIEALPYPGKLSEVDERRIHAIGAFNEFLDRLKQSANGTGTRPVCQCGNDKAARKCDDALLRAVVKRLSQGRRPSLAKYLGNPPIPNVMASVGNAASSQPRTFRVNANKCSFELLKKLLERIQLGHACKAEHDRQKQEAEKQKSPLNINNILADATPDVPFDPFSSLPQPQTFPADFSQQTISYGLPDTSSICDYFTDPTNLSLPDLSFAIPNLNAYNADASSSSEVNKWSEDAWMRLNFDLPNPYPQRYPCGFEQNESMKQLTEASQHMEQQQQEPTFEPCMGPKKSLAAILREIESRILDLSKTFEVIRVE